jgi:hypothetical protein
MRKLLSVVVTGVMAGSLMFGTAAEAAGTCTSGGAAGKPAALTGGKWSLWNVKRTGYTGTPFSFKIRIKRGGFPDAYTYQWYTYDAGYRHSMNTGAIRPGAADWVQTWCGGKRGADWRGTVYSR